ncbi:MAG: hypothetical protein GY796_16905 [Chloroflexi bacterium]|nr:hypothetical protein [Chloroflexota bacterium]
MPNLNPDAVMIAPGLVDGRLNANGVDLNRNWDCRWQENNNILGEFVAGNSNTAVQNQLGPPHLPNKLPIILACKILPTAQLCILPIMGPKRISCLRWKMGGGCLEIGLELRSYTELCHSEKSIAADIAMDFSE